MAKNKVSRSKQDLKLELNDQLDMLRAACAAYDNGIEASGKTIAVILRVLLYHYKSSRSLLDQLNYKGSRFVSTSEEFDDSNFAPRINILIINVRPESVKWDLKASIDPNCIDARRLIFVDWWNETIVLDGKGKRFSRMDLVMNVADKDGGAHVDPELIDSYMDLTRGNSMGYKFGEEDIPFTGRPILACMRQIAHEVIATLKINNPDLAERVLPIIPQKDDFPVLPDEVRQKIKVAFSIPEKLKGIKDLKATASLNPVKNLRDDH